jgi:3-dehydroquinate synthase
MNIIPVHTKSKDYPILIENGLFPNIAEEFCELSHGQKWIVVSQEELRELYQQPLIKILRDSDFDVQGMIIESSEDAKTLDTIEDICRIMIELECDRSSIIIALGGGVVGDIAGFLASVFMRGIEYIQIPTTLLAMIDSSIGGKTGVNLPEGKNLVGTFHQPTAVIIDPEILKSLPEREIVSGFGELLKYGLIWDFDWFKEIANTLDHHLKLTDYELLTKTLVRCCEIKAEVVSADEKEGGFRRILNFGHTIGHAIESTIGYDIVRHGEAVTMGMISACHISYIRGHIVEDDFSLIVKTLSSLPLPALDNLDIEKVIETMRFDKKNVNGKLHFVLLDPPGRAVVVDDIKGIEIISSLNFLRKTLIK